MAPRGLKGRPREERVDEAVRDAVRALLVEEGYEGTTLARVAERAGVGRGAVYRRWRSKAQMVFAAAVHDVDIRPPDDLRGLDQDIAALCERIADIVATPAARAAFTGLARESPDRLGLSATLERLFAAERQYVARILQRATERGEIGAGADPEVVRRLLVGSIAFVPTFSADRPIAVDRIATLVSAGLRGAYPPAANGPAVADGTVP